MCMNMYIYMIIYVFNINLKNEIFFFRGKFLIDYVMPQIQFSKNVLTKFGETPNSLSIAAATRPSCSFFNMTLTCSKGSKNEFSPIRLASILLKNMISDFNEGKAHDIKTSYLVGGIPIYPILPLPLLCQVDTWSMSVQHLQLIGSDSPAARCLKLTILLSSNQSFVRTWVVGAVAWQPFAQQF